MGKATGSSGRNSKKLKPVTSISSTRGHLTSTQKQAIRAILNKGLMQGRVGRTDYFLSTNDNRTYTAKIRKAERAMIGSPLRPTTSNHTFTVER